MADGPFVPNSKPSPSLKVLTLHGDLDLWIYEACSLPNMDMFSERLNRCFAFSSSSCAGGIPRSPDNPHPRHPHVITSDPYVGVTLAGAVVARTAVIPNSQDPVWNEHFNAPLAHAVPYIDFVVKDNDVFGADLIGTVSIPASLIALGKPIDGWFPIIGPKGEPPEPGSALRIRLHYTPVGLNKIYCHGIAGDPEHLGVRDAYFPLRKGGAVTLYQDAHVKDGDLPEIEMEKGRVYGHERCWEDICHAILEAHRLIYIAGWSIYDKVRLVREPTRPLPRGGELTLGELLKYKSQEGVRVCLLVWDDKSSSDDTFFLKTKGVMGTHDEETRKFFKHSSVICVLSPRYGSNKLSVFKQQVVGTIYSHHQKCVLVDTQYSPNYRKITAFLGGLDLCDGRYDTPEHRLFQDLNTVFSNDFHNPTFPTESKGPRQPWHDLHCKIEGPAAYDVLTNFEQRWRKAAKWWELKGWFSRVSHSNDDALIKLDRISWIVSPSLTIPPDDPSLWICQEDNDENWHVQIFRSIDSGSVKDFPKDVQKAREQNLVCEKNVVIDKSIHTAYVRAIRSAKHFIYIENQYFIGSCYGWPSYNNSGADNLVPMELALKITSKIRAGERFAVYVVIPMWPEGDPNSAAVQQILFCQTQTMQMMYELIAKEIKLAGLIDSRPEDYLNFFCLGKREVLKNTLQSITQISEKSAAVFAQKYHRFMIYVHSKGMIVDDEYLILGSANINQRSLDGSRDTEIAMGGYQPHHTWAMTKRHPQGQIYGYRMSLWAEHLGMVKDTFKEPHSLQCARAVNRIADDNWVRYTAEQTIPLQGHLLKYPVRIDPDGKVGAPPGQEYFPDVGGKILGSRTNLPDALTA